MSDLNLTPGCEIRNGAGAELDVIGRVHGTSQSPRHPALESVTSSLGEIWIVASYHKPFGVEFHLATADGLAACGYEVVSTPEGATHA